MMNRTERPQFYLDLNAFIQIIHQNEATLVEVLETLHALQYLLESYAADNQVKEPYLAVHIDSLLSKLSRLEITLKQQRRSHYISIKLNHQKSVSLLFPTIQAPSLSQSKFDASESTDSLLKELSQAVKSMKNEQRRIDIARKQVAQVLDLYNTQSPVDNIETALPLGNSLANIINVCDRQQALLRQL